eukprot:759067-Hanusia_phi.AAC.5
MAKFDTHLLGEALVFTDQLVDRLPHLLPLSDFAASGALDLFVLQHKVRPLTASWRRRLRRLIGEVPHDLLQCLAPFALPHARDQTPPVCRRQRTTVQALHVYCHVPHRLVHRPHPQLVWLLSLRRQEPAARHPPFAQHAFSWELHLLAAQVSDALCQQSQHEQSTPAGFLYER